jgi:hypothetical protein
MTNLRPTISNITQYESMQGYYLTVFYLLQAGINQRHFGLT